MEVKTMPFEEIAEQYTPMIHQIIKRLHLYKDIDSYIQLGLIGLWEATQRFEEDKGSFLNFAYMTVRGKILSQLRREIQFYEHHSFSDEDVFLFLADVGTTNPLFLDMLEELMTPLNENERQWLTKTVLEQKKPGEIAVDLGVHVDRVKYWRKQAIMKLKTKGV